MVLNDLLSNTEYNFLRENEHLGDNIILLGLGGSHAYGTNIETSDLDIRGCALNTKEEILTNKNFEQFVNEKTDTTIYAFNKLISLLCNCNPNTIEMLGNKPEHYFYVSPIGREFINNKDLFLRQLIMQCFTLNKDILQCQMMRSNYILIKLFRRDMIRKFLWM